MSSDDLPAERSPDLFADLSHGVSQGLSQDLSPGLSSGLSSGLSPGSSPGLRSGLWRDGLWRRNAALVQLLGLCPLLAVSTSVINALALGVATLVTLLVSNIAISALRHRVPDTVRLPLQILVIATTVTLIETSLAGWLPALHASLGIFLPLIVTNCLILGRAESLARRAPPGVALIDALATGCGFAAVLLLLGTIRELIGRGTLVADAAILFGERANGWEIRFFDADHGLLLAMLPPGAFLLLGLLLALRNLIDAVHR